MRRVSAHCLIPKPLLLGCRKASLSATFDTAYFAEMRYRLIGPFRGGRTVAISGVVQQPNVYYMAPNNGGVWKSTDYGNTWIPIFDGQDTGSIGALAVAPSDPNIIYVGSGEGLQRPDLSVGDGMYKSIDAGRHGSTWACATDSRSLQSSSTRRIRIGCLSPFWAIPTGLIRSAAFIARPMEANRSSRSYTKMRTRARSKWRSIPPIRKIIYAALWAARQAPWEIGGSFNGPGSGLFKSTDGGETWNQLTQRHSHNCARAGTHRVRHRPERSEADVCADGRISGIWRSVSFRRCGRQLAQGEQRIAIWGRGSDFACVQVDPKDEEQTLHREHDHLSIDGGGQNISRRSKARRGATIITPSGSILRTRTSSSSASIRAQRSA